MRLLVVMTFVIYFTSTVAVAQIFNSSTTSSTAGSGRAAVDVGEASFLNPATLVHQPGRQILISQSQSEFAAALSEYTKDIIFPAALGYVQKKMDGPLNPILHDMRLTLAEPVTGKIGVGFTGHYYQVTDELDQYKQTNFDVGVIYTPAINLGFGLVSYDVIGEKSEMPMPYRLQTRTGLGVNWLFRPTMRFRWDELSGSNNNFNKLTTMVGYEVYLNRWVVGRIGLRDDSQAEQRFASLGMGLDLPKFDINYAFVSELPRNASERHSIDLAISF